MKSLYSSPLKVYLALGLLTILGAYSGFKLPISLFPNTTRPLVFVSLKYGNSSAEDFRVQNGSLIEGRLKGINSKECEVESVESTYSPDSVSYEVQFKWHSDPKCSLRETESTVYSATAHLPSEVRDSIGVNSWNRSGGFFAVSFYSTKVSLTELYKELEPMFSAHYAKVTDAEEIGLWNPEIKEIHVELDPNKLARFEILPKNIFDPLYHSLNSWSAGIVRQGDQDLPAVLPAQSFDLETLSQFRITGPGGTQVPLTDLGQILVASPMSKQQVMKTSGASSLILFASPRSGGNIKRMSEQLREIVLSLEPSLPEHVEYKILVDPSIFIGSAVKNVVKEVAIAAGLAVLVLFFFIGSLKNVLTAAIEIPMSLILAFILMKWSGMNLNIISLGGLALSAGMNVDASVVVMENIFRHFEKIKNKLSAGEKLEVLVRAVNEVKLPIIASTLASIVVFIPLMLTEGLGAAILGDLAKAVVFSHGLSAVVALILVPTIRLQMMSAETQFHARSPVESLLNFLEHFYKRTLKQFIEGQKIKVIVYTSLALVLGALIVWGLPHLPREIIGKPDSEWLVVRVENSTFSNFRQMESQSDETESQLLTKFGHEISYTFTQIRSPQNSVILARLKDQSQMKRLWKEFESEFKDSTDLKFRVGPFSPSELPVPDPPQMEIQILGQKNTDMAHAAQELYDILESKQVFPRLWIMPESKSMEKFELIPRRELWTEQLRNNYFVNPLDLADYLRVATQGKKVGTMKHEDQRLQVNLRLPHRFEKTATEIESLPLGVGGRILPLKALAELKKTQSDPPTYVKNQQTQVLLQGTHLGSDKKNPDEALKRVDEVLSTWKQGDSIYKDKVTVSRVDSMKELTESLNQLGVALALSVVLIFVVMIFQLGSLADSLLVLVSVPLGFIGVIGSLLVFSSTLSINSALGVILLNGIVVANSIILVDFLKNQVKLGLSPLEAALEAAQARLRPILMTSLTTGLGMLPIALGFGEGGRILQPLGITVCGGLFFSLFATLYVVPALQVSYLKWKK